MKHTVFFKTLLGVFVFHSSMAGEMKTAGTIPVHAGDTSETIVQKAAHVVPTPNQLKALQNEFIAFACIGPNTFTRKEWGNGKEEPAVFALKTLDTDQWCKAMRGAGMTMVILTVKHHDGFCLWQTRYTNHGIMSTGYKNGKGDVLMELTQSLKKYGLKLGIYLSPADLYQIESPEGLYGNGSEITKRTIPREVQGREFNNKTRFEFDVDDYNEYFLSQLFELLTEYGPVHEVWFDGAHPKRKGGQKYNYKAWRELIHALAPEAVIFGKEDIRWCGNEAGKTRATEWNVIPYPYDPRVAQEFPDMTADELAGREQLQHGKFLHYQPTEVDTSIREGWFYRDDNNQKVRNADDVFDIYERSVGGNTIFLLNIPPNREGRLSSADIQCLDEVGRRIRETYGTDLLRGADAPLELMDDDINTFVQLAGNEGEMVFSLSKPITINRFLLQEAIAQHGERIEDHALDAWVNGEWKEMAKSTNVGYKRILRFADVTTDRIRVRILKSRHTPAVAKVSAHYYRSRPPQLFASVSADNQVSLAPVRHSFGWKPSGENALKNLNGTIAIHYTTDNSTPTEKSPLYERPFKMTGTTLRATAFSRNQKGPELREIIGYPKCEWKVLKCSGQTDGQEAAKAFDEDKNTCWTSPEGNSPHFIEIDLGSQRQLQGFSYTPPPNNPQGMLERGILRMSDDGEKWTIVTEFEFGNLINDPVKREHFFKSKVKGRYIRVEATSIAAEGKVLNIAELSFF